MCSGAIFWSGIKKVVFGLRSSELYSLVEKETGDSSFAWKISAKELFSKGTHQIEVVGPILEDEARQPHIGFWKQSQEKELNKSTSSSNSTKIRKSFVMKLYEGKEKEYEERHNPIWKNLEDAIHEHGGSNYSIYLNEKTKDLFGYIEIEDEEKWDEIAKTQLMKEWWKSMSHLMESGGPNENYAPKVSSLKPVFFFLNDLFKL